LPVRVLRVLAGCAQRACARPSPGARAPAPAALPPPGAAPPAAPEPPEARLAGKHFVIVHSSPLPGEGEPLLERLRAEGLGAEARRLSSTPFGSLRPCLELVVAGAFSDAEQARALVQRLSVAGVKSYLKSAGPLARDWEQREADCRQQAEVWKAPPRVGASGPRFLDLRGERTFVLLSEGPQDTPGAPLRQVGEDRGFWMAALGEDPTGTFKKGQAFEVYDAQGPIKVDCRVKGFASLHRGIAHFSYFQQLEAPKEPGCGKTWPVAELDCSLMNTRVRESLLAFVLPRGSPVPRYYARVEPLPEPLKAAQEQALRALPAYAKVHAQAQAHAREQGAPLSESLELRAFSAQGRQVVVGVARFQTGLGHPGCGGPDYRDTVSRAVALSGDGRESPVGGALDGESLLAVLDLEDDGAVELLTRSPRDTSQVALVREHGSRVTASFLPQCDTNC